MKGRTSSEVHLVRRPKGFPKETDFEFVDVELPAISEGEILVENLFLSVDPYMRENMDAVWTLNAPLEGRSVGRVVESRDTTTPKGVLVSHRAGWRSFAVIRGVDARVLPSYPGLSPRVFLSALGGTGLTAYVGLKYVAKLKKGEAIFISAAAGGVGSIAGQIARVIGASHVAGSAGSQEKVLLLVDRLGFDVAFNYKTGDVGASLRRVAPNGIDVYFDNVGGEQLEAAIDVLHDAGRIAWCGAVAQYNSPDPPAAPRNLFDIVGKSLTLSGFLVSNFRHLQEEYEQFVVPYLQAGEIESLESVISGFGNIVSAFIDMLHGGNLGKRIVALNGADADGL